MAIIKVDYGTIGGGINTLTQIYSPTTNEGVIDGSAIPVTNGKTYLVIGAISSNSLSNTYSVNGGTLLGQTISLGAGLFSQPAYSIVLLVRATSSSITINVSGSVPHLYSGQLVEIN